MTLTFASKRGKLELKGYRQKITFPLPLELRKLNKVSKVFII
jgi:hypothetical protein